MVTGLKNKSLTKISIPKIVNGKPVTEIANLAFDDCVNLSYVDIPTGVKIIGEGAFRGCKNLENISIPNGLEKIKFMAFISCESLQSLIIPQSTTHIDYRAFDFNCKSLRHIYYCGSQAQFKNALINGLEILEPISEEEIQELLWDGEIYCRDVLDDGSISSYAIIPTIHYNFIYDYPVEIVEVGTCGDNLTWSLDDKGTLTIKGSGNMYNYTNGKGSNPSPFFSDKKIYNCVIESEVTSIGDYAFTCCNELANISIPNTVTSIGRCAFGSEIGSCTSLTSVEISEGVTYIGDEAFEGCENLKSVTIPSSVISICNYAFWRCPNLTSITIPANVTFIGDDAFSHRSLLVIYGMKNSCAETYANKHNIPFKAISEVPEVKVDSPVISPNSRSFSKSQKISISCATNGAVIYYTTNGSQPTTSSKKYNGAFTIFSDTTVKAIAVKDGIESSVVAATFDRKSSSSSSGGGTSGGSTSDKKTDDAESKTCGEKLTWTLSTDGKLTISGTGKMDCSSAPFEYTREITECVIKDGVTSIGNRAFFHCSNLTNITIPNSVTQIDNEAFGKCANLKTVTLPNKITAISSGMFIYCESLESLTIPNGVNSIGDEAFRDCVNLSSVTIPENVTHIGRNAFKGCEQLTIYGVRNSYAYEYAKIYGFSFKSISNTDLVSAGDLDGDGVVTFDDVNAMIDYFLHGYRSSTSPDPAKYDLSNDGMFDFDDVSMSIYYFLNS